MQLVWLFCLRSILFPTSTILQAALGSPVKRSPWTVGASVEVLVHSYRAGMPDETAYFVELWDIGGSRSHRNARRVFYQQVNGLILVHDMTNRKSEENLRSWLAEIFHTATAPTQLSYGLKRNDSNSRLPQSIFDGEQFISEQHDIPMLFVGAKLDQLGANVGTPPATPTPPASMTGNKSTPPNRLHSHSSRLAQECTADELWLDCRQPISPGSTNGVKLTRFFDRVIEKQEQKKAAVGSPAMGNLLDRRRKLAFP